MRPAVALSVHCGASILVVDVCAALQIIGAAVKPARRFVDGDAPLKMGSFARKMQKKQTPCIARSVCHIAETVAALKAQPGKDIWLGGGGGLFRSLLDARLVDTIEVGVIPTLLSQGVPLLTAGQRSPVLRLTDSKTLPSGIVMLSYALQYGDA